MIVGYHEHFGPYWWQTGIVRLGKLKHPTRKRKRGGKRGRERERERRGGEDGMMLSEAGGGLLRPLEGRGGYWKAVKASQAPRSSMRETEKREK